MPSEQELWDCYNGLLLSPDVERIRKLLVRYELFKLALDVPGDVVECGVFKGAGLMYWLKLLRIYAPAARKRVVGFDTFGAFADSLLPYERQTAQAYVDEASFAGADPAAMLALAGEAGFEGQVELVPGDVRETAARYVREHPGFRVSLLHLDLDTYVGTRAALEALYPVVVPGGVVVLDEYGQPGWGESDAVDEYFAGQAIRIRRVPFSNKPTAFIVK